MPTQRLTQPQIKMLKSAHASPKGEATAGLGPRQKTAYKLEELGYGTTRFYGCLIFCINDAGREKAEQV